MDFCALSVAGRGREGGREEGRGDIGAIRHTARADMIYSAVMGAHAACPRLSLDITKVAN